MIELVEKIVSLVSSIVTLIAAIIAYKATKKQNSGGRNSPAPFGVNIIITQSKKLCKYYL